MDVERFARRALVLEGARGMIALPTPPPEYQSINWCRDCQLERHQRCFDPTCHCEHSDHPAMIPLSLRPKCVVGDAFWRATGGD